MSAQRDGERWTLVFVRDLTHPSDAVWLALTDPAELREWAPDRALAKDPIGRILAEDAHAHGWDELDAGYAERLSGS